jgi:peptidoglycan hydrolase CwlO-like protein
MNYSNLETSPQTEAPKSSPVKNIIIGALAVCLVGLGAYTITNKNKSVEQIQQQQTQIEKVSDEKSNVQNNFDASLARLDSMATLNTNLQGKLTDKNSEIAKVKSEIRSILNKKNASASELARAKNLIADLNGKISGMEADIARLTDDNKTLSAEKVVLTQDKEKLSQDLVVTNTAKIELEKKVDVASTLNANNISVTPINVKANGKETISTNAKRVDKFLISFDVNNRIAEPGTTDLFVLITGPDGKTLVSSGSTITKFATREDGEKEFTAKVPVALQTAEKKNVEFAFVPDNNFKQGNYKIQIYQNGFLIGEGTKELRKGGLFS